MEEIWVDLRGFENKYLISNFGRMKSTDRYFDTNMHGKTYHVCRKGKLLNIRNYKNKPLVTLRDTNQKQYFINVAREVWKHFVDENLSPNECIIFKDNNPLNCKLDNLIIENRGKYCNKNQIRYFDYYGFKLSIQEICKIFGLNLNTLNYRLRTGWNIYEAIETPVGNNYKNHLEKLRRKINE